MLYMLVNPIVLIPCLFVGASNQRFPLALLLGWICSAIGGIFTFPLIHFFIVSSPAPPAGRSALLSSIVAAVLAGTIATSAMYLLSKGKQKNDAPSPNGTDGA
jgi:hypothetical protein